MPKTKAAAKKRKPPEKPPTLTPIDLSKRVECSHPDITTRGQYLVKYEGRYYAGSVTREWYGISLDMVYDAGVQLDDEDIQAIWKIT